MGEAGQATRDSIPDSGSILKYCLVMEFGLLDRDPNRPACSCGIGNKLCLYVDFRNYPPVDLAKIQECPEAKDKGYLWTNSLKPVGKGLDSHCK